MTYSHADYVLKRRGRRVALETVRVLRDEKREYF